MRFHIPGPALGYTISPDPSFPHAHAVCGCAHALVQKGLGNYSEGSSQKPHREHAPAVCGRAELWIERDVTIAILPA